ncbi:MAG: TorF family putative porin [Hyphomicrobium sp.]|jgi:uncharacterized protein (TIGR02001 family)
MMKKVQVLAVSALAAGFAFAGPAAAEEAREFTWSVTGTGTSDYIFRGFSQTNESPAAQASIDIGYGIFYAGIWGSNIDLDGGGLVFGSGEVDFYAGIKPVVGPVTFDLGVLYYYYPGAEDGVNGAESDYVEFKLGAAITPFTNASLSGAYYYTPDNFLETDAQHTIEGTLGYTLPAFGIFTPTVSGTVGYAKSDQDLYEGDDNYVYWNAGVALAVEKFTFDFRYWDTNLSDTDIADSRFVFSARVTLP